MIEKIPFETETITHDGKTMEVQTHASPYDLQVKINELVDIINAITIDVDGVKCVDGSKKVEPAENIYTKTCRMDKEFAEEELDRTRKALDKAIWWLNEIVNNHRFTPISTAEKALKEINEITKGKE